MIILQKFRIKGHSMEPTIKDGGEVLVSDIPLILFGANPKDILLFKKNNEPFVKRIKNIKGNKYFLLGDNKKDSLDSESLGWVDKKDIIGKVIIIL